MSFHDRWRKWGISDFLKVRRLKAMNRALNGLLSSENLAGKRVLEVGCGRGADFLRYLDKYEGCELYGVDIRTYPELPVSVRFSLANASSLPFDDGFFDLVVSIGVLEHISPIERLCDAVSEMRRVGRRVCAIVPCVSTIIEPHLVSPIWQLRSAARKRPYSDLNYFSDEAWGRFQGFSDARIERFAYLPPLISNVMITA